VWGPKARDVVASVTDDDLAGEGFPFGSARWVTLGSVRALMVRISYVGELGWEIHAPMEHGTKLWDTIHAAGQEFGIVPAGIGVYGTTGRMEKGYRLMGAELESEYTPVDADLALPKVKSAEFNGKEAYLQAREDGPVAVMCTLTVEDHTSASGIPRYPNGGEPIVTPEGEPLVDAHGRRSYVTSAGSGPSLGKHLLMAYLPPEQAEEGRELAVEYMTERYPVVVARAGRTPLFDPDDERMKA
jgi:glycine cleavage system aminomethyltransferase T